MESKNGNDTSLSNIHIEEEGEEEERLVEMKNGNEEAFKIHFSMKRGGARGGHGGGGSNAIHHKPSNTKKSNGGSLNIYMHPLNTIILIISSTSYIVSGLLLFLI
ncbi:uncharacterized protein [Spinacia oleracea]|uniref:Uncharacterized protein isoform X2 n=1 Tax=Spinacia oleracea TaxID=3562 RepID=A0ABM3RC35_SPIOL|nr:uncharacterized protein LOC110792771 isoform X2 [Spinacia oleracea]